MDDCDIIIDVKNKKFREALAQQQKFTEMAILYEIEEEVRRNKRKLTLSYYNTVSKVVMDRKMLDTISMLDQQFGDNWSARGKFISLIRERNISANRIYDYLTSLSDEEFNLIKLEAMLG